MGERPTYGPITSCLAAFPSAEGRSPVTVGMNPSFTAPGPGHLSGWLHLSSSLPPLTRLNSYFKMAFVHQGTSFEVSLRTLSLFLSPIYTDTHTHTYTQTQTYLVHTQTDKLTHKQTNSHTTPPHTHT